MSVRRAAVWSLTFPFPPPCPLASFVYLALATLTSLSKGASKGIAPFSHYVKDIISKVKICREIISFT